MSRRDRALALASANALAGAARAGFDDLDRLIFVANRTAPEIAVVDSARDRVIGQIAVAGGPHQFVLSDQLGLLIASHLAPDALSIVDLRGEETRRLDLDVSPEQLAISPAGDLVAISSAQDDAVILLAPRGDRAPRRIDALGAPGDLVFDRTGERLFVASTSGAEVALIDVAAARAPADRSRRRGGRRSWRRARLPALRAASPALHATARAARSA